MNGRRETVLTRGSTRVFLCFFVEKSLRRAFPEKAQHRVISTVFGRYHFILTTQKNYTLVICPNLLHSQPYFLFKVSS